MDVFKNLKLTTRLLLMFALLTLITVLLGYFVFIATHSAAGLLITLLGAGVIMTAIFGLYITGSVGKPIEEIRKVIGKMALNDYTDELKAHYTGTMKELADSVNALRGRMLSVQDAFERVGRGDSGRLEEFERIGKRSENDKLMPACISAMRSIREIINETGKLTKAAVGGDLSERGNTDRFEGGYRDIIAGFNHTLDAVVEPMNDAMAVLGKYSNNDLTVRLEKKYAGFFNTFATAVNDVQARLLAVQRIAQKVSRGDMSELEGFKKIGKRSENDNLMPAFIGMMEAIRNLYLEVDVLTKAAIEGDLSKRCAADRFEGDYKEIVLGLNRLIDTFILPMEEAGAVLQKMAVNDYTVEMKGRYKGQFETFATSVNTVRTRLLSVQDAFDRVGKGDTSRLEEFEKIGKRSDNDKIMPACTAALKSVRGLVAEVGRIAEAVIVGDLNVRGDGSKFDGGYREIVEGLNRTIEAVAMPIAGASSVMQEMARGNLNVTMTGTYGGFYGKMQADLNNTIKSFNDVLNDINNAAFQVASGAKQISDSSQALAHGATTQASSVEELSATIEEITTQTRQNAENASRANEFALAAKVDAELGDAQMKEMLKAVQDINEASSNISKIIKVIDEIAFQTNILALNAAVEAARAGQHGKGFAVVAVEVRNLAARSAHAARETTDLIEGTIKKAEEGTKIASETAKALNSIVDGVAKAASLVGDIAEASNEQALGIEQVNQGIIQVSQVIQTNSATSEESAAASEELSSQAETLKGLVGNFQLSEEGAYGGAQGPLNHELVKMIETMMDKKMSVRDQAPRSAEPGKYKINLSDREFGKY